MPPDPPLKHSTGTANGNRIVAALCIVLGAIPMGLATGIFPARPGSLHAPRTIIFLAGLLFWLAAASLLIGSNRARLNHLFGAGLMAVFAIVGGWVSVFGFDSAFTGGMPFVSAAANEWIARAMFGGGAILCAALSAYAFVKALSLEKPSG